MWNCSLHIRALDKASSVLYNRIIDSITKDGLRLYVLILNPEAGCGKALACLGEVETLLQQRGMEYRVDRADEPEAATRFARRAVEEGCDGVIVIGGDGTIFNVVNGMVGSELPLLFVSCGTGNDFVRSLRLPSNPIEALRVQLDAKQRRIDVGRMNSLYFLNVSGTGFDVDVLRHAEEYKRKYTGLTPYLRGLRDAVREYRPQTALLSFDGGPEERVSFAILSVGNGRFIGGGMRAVPEAQVDDGLFDVVIVKPVRRWMILPLIVFFITGKHVALRLARTQRCRRFSVRCEGMTINLDGELRSADSARYELLPGALTVRLPGDV